MAADLELVVLRSLAVRVVDDADGKPEHSALDRREGLELGRRHGTGADSRENLGHASSVVHPHREGGLREVCAIRVPEPQLAAPGSYCASILASSSSVPCRMGPLNHFLADTMYQPPKSRKAAPTVRGV